MVAPGRSPVNAIYQDSIFVRWALNSVIYAVVTATLSTLLSTMAGFVFAKYHFT